MPSSHWDVSTDPSCGVNISATSLRKRMMQLYNFSTCFLCKHSKRKSQFKSSGWNRQSVWTNCVVKTAFYSTLLIQAFLYFIQNCYYIKYVVHGYEENQECVFLEAVSSHSLSWHNCEINSSSEIKHCFLYIHVHTVYCLDLENNCSAPAVKMPFIFCTEILIISHNDKNHPK